MGVVFIESSNYYYFNFQHLTLLQAWLRLMLYAGVPGYFILSGFILGKNINKPFEALPFIRKKFNSLIIPFLIWNVIYIVFAFYSFHWEILSLSSLRSLLTGFISMYFLFALMQLFIVFALMQRFFKNHPLKWLIASLIISLGSYAVMDYTVWSKLDLQQSSEWNMLRVFLPWLFFFSLGIYLGMKEPLLKRLEQLSWLLVILAGIALYGYSWEAVSTFEFANNMPRSYFYLAGFFYQVFAALLVIGLSQKIARINGAFTNYLISSGKDTFAIYLAIQLPIGVIGMTTLANFSLTYVFAYILFNFVVTFFGLQIIIRLVRKYDLTLIQKCLFGGR